MTSITNGGAGPVRPGVLGVIGMGYVGLPTALSAASAGWRVVGFDIDARLVESLNQGNSHLPDVPDSLLKHALSSDSFGATCDMARLGECDVILICVPTPISRSKEPDLSAVEAAARCIAASLRRGQLIVLESTTYPGTTVEVVQPILESAGLIAGVDFLLAFAPERMDPGNSMYRMADIPKVVGGLTLACTEAALAFYRGFVKQAIPVSSPSTAEMVKIYENVFRCVNIAFVNELAVLCNRMDIDIWEVIEAASTKPYGFMPFYPGPGLGGHCIPVDPHYLAWKARHHDFHVKFIELAASINDNMPYFVCERITTALNDHEKCVKGSRILVLGVTYKRDIPDLRESPALRIIELLHDRGAEVVYNDPLIATLNVTVGSKQIDLESQPLSPENLRATDCCVIVTDHSAYDWSFVTEHANLIVDTRNALKNTSVSRERAYRL